MKLRISTNKEELNVEFIHQFLTDTYWAKGRTAEEVENTISHSLCFGVYLNDIQIGFARIVSDYTIFAYLMDVFIVEEYRGKGYSKILMESIINEAALKKVKRWGLATLDAHSLYEKFGFKNHEKPENMMVKINNNT